MKNLCVSLRRVLMLVLLGCFSVSAFSQKVKMLRSFSFSQEFYDAMARENIQSFRFGLYFRTIPDSTRIPQFQEDYPSYDFNAKDKRIFKISNNPVRLDIEGKEKVTLYYELYSDYIFVNKGCVEVPVADLDDFQFNPLEGLKKVRLRSPLGKDGELLAADFIFVNDVLRRQPVGITPYNRKAGVEVLPEGERDPYTDELIPAAPGYSAFWAEPGRKIPYLICPKVDYSEEFNKEHNAYFWYEGVWDTDLDYPQPLTVDYHYATEVRLYMKGVMRGGEELSWTGVMDSGSRDLYFNSFFSWTDDLFDFGRRVDYGMRPCYILSDSDRGYYDLQDTYMRFYALPGSYFLEVWGNRPLIPWDSRLSPRGIYGLIDVEDKQVQKVDFDLSKYMSFRFNSNIDVEFNPRSCLYKRSGAANKGLNKLTGQQVLFDFGRPNIWADSFIAKDKDADGKTVTKIWAPLGYEIADIEGGRDFKVENYDVNNSEVYIFELPNYYPVRCIGPKVVMEHGGNWLYFKTDADTKTHRNVAPLGAFDPVLNAEGQQVAQPKYHNNDQVYSPEYFEEKDTIVDYLEKGDYEILLHHYNYNDNMPASQRVSVNEVDTAEVEVGLERAVIFDITQRPKEDRFDYKLEMLNDTLDFHRLCLAKAEGEGYEQYFCLFPTQDAYSYRISGSEMIPYKTSFKVEEKCKIVFPPIDSYQKLSFSREGNKWLDLKNAVWKDGEGTEYSFIFSGGDLKKYIYCMPGLVEFDLWYKNLNVSSANGVPLYKCKYNFDGEPSYQFPNFVYRVSFYRGEEELPVYGKNRHDELDGEVKVYALSYPFTNREVALEVVQGRRVYSVELFPGLYCAEDGQGHKVYFEVNKAMDIDFNNPPVPPTGIEDAEMDAAAPAAYYDACGRRLDAPRKGLNIIRLQDGTVRKVMVK